MTAGSEVTAIVVAHDSADVIGDCLAALAAEGVRAIVVDNRSTDRTAELAAAAGAAIVTSGRNEGYGRGNNLGVEAAATRYVLICNPDVTVEPGSMAALLDAAARFPDAGLWAPLIVEPDGRRFVQPRSLLSPWHLNQARKILIPEGAACIPFVSGACFLMERSLFQAMGGFDRDIFLYFEDDDLCRRLMAAGHPPLLIPEARVKHLRGQSAPPTLARRFNARWHTAWSERHVRAKHGLPPPSVMDIGWSAFAPA